MLYNQVMPRDQQFVGIVHWVVVRDQSGKVVNAESFTDHKKALRCKNDLEEAQSEPGQITSVKIETYIHPDSPYQH